MKFNLRKILLISALAFVSNFASAQRYSDKSVLSDGIIYKLGVVSDAVYHITYDDMVSWGINPASLNPKKISLFGNASGMLPEDNSKENYDDLTEMAIFVKGEDDGVFDKDDEIIFYGQSPVVWNFENGNFCHQINYYSDTTCYFLKIDNQQIGKRIGIAQQAEGDVFNEVTTFCDRQYHEIDLDNHLKMGRKWYGEAISGQTQKMMTFPFVFKNAITGQDGFVRFGFIGASSNENFNVRLAINGEPIMDDIYVYKVGDYYFGRELLKEAEFSVNSENVDASVEVMAENASTMVGLDFIDVNVWRRLRYENEQLNFTVSESSGHEDVNLIEIENSSDDMLFLDVTDPLSPENLDYTLINSMIHCKARKGMKSYVLAGRDDFQKVKSCKRIENQNLHGHSDADYAEMLIITDRIFEKQAEEIKTIHEDADNMVTYIAYVDDIYNEFSSGSLDITGIRNFIRMVYERSEGLKYVLLLGRGSCDYKNILGYSNNFVPPYEAENVVYQLSAYVSDDYYGLMGDDEGEQLAGKVDLGVGRIPVLDVAEAETVVDKIRRYIDASKSMRNWRNDLVLIADNEKTTYSKGCDALEKIVDTMQPSINVSKIYSDAYVRKQNSDGSYCAPEATAEIMNKFSQGALMMTYLGHGGVKGLSKSNLFKTDDIINLDNYDRLPFVTTGTCEFSAFDDPTFVSAGERLFKMNEGGAIAMYTSTRPTHAPENLTIMKNLYRNAFMADRPRSRTMGEIIMETKRDNSANTSNYVSYVFFGDPALKLAYPLKDIRITSINGREVNKDHIIGAMGTLTASGYVADVYGNVDTTFNGYVNVKMFDNESQYTTLNNYGFEGNYHTFTCHVDVLFEGKASVENGTFSITYKVPKDVNMQKGKARLSLYAVDTVRMIDANGCFKNIKIDGVADVETDDEGPDIQLLWNGTVPDEKPVYCDGTLSATISDPQGIYHYNSVIGKNVTLTHVFDGQSVVENVNGRFETAIDDFTKGALEIDFKDLKSGTHEFIISAWDTHDNNSTRSIVINVYGNNYYMSLANVVNTPNPFSDKTSFSFRCDKHGVAFDMTIKIYDISGRLVNELQYNNLTSDCNEVEWDGTDFKGRRLISGVYVYNVFVKDIDGDIYSTNQKMIITR